MSTFADTLDRLAATIAERRSADPASSYTASLLQGGMDRIAKKLGEEAVEMVIAAVTDDTSALADEAADVIYHFLLTLAAAGVSLDEVAARLQAREGQSGLAEKAARGT